MTAQSRLPTGTVTMLFTDIEGSTRLLKQLGEAYGTLLSDHRRLLREAFAAHGGREIDTQGDAFFVAFGRARAAVEAAVEAQRALAAHAWPEGVECRVRMGLHTGEPSALEGGYHGIGLHRGARVADVAHGGQILLSSATAELIQDDLPAGMNLRDLGKQQLKDIDRPERLYQLVADGLRPQFPSPRTARSKRPSRLAGAVVTAAVLLAVATAGIVRLTRGDSRPAVAATVSADSLGIFDAADGRLSGQIPVAASPGAVAPGDGSIWVANVDAHSVTRIDPAKRTEIQTIQVGNGPDAIASGGGFVWVANGLDGTVTKIDPSVDQQVDTIDVGNAPGGIAVDSRYVWVANATDGTITRIDLGTDKPLAPISVGQSADGVAIGFGSVWVTSQAAGTVTRLDEASGTPIQPIETGGGADAVVAGLKAVWVANSLDGNVSRIDPGTDNVHSTIPVGDGASGLAIAAGSVWVSNELAGTLTLIDPATDTPGRPLTTGNRPGGMAAQSGSLFVAVSASGAGHRGGTLTVLTSPSYFYSVDPAKDYDLPQNQMAMMTTRTGSVCR